MMIASDKQLSTLRSNTKPQSTQGSVAVKPERKSDKPNPFNSVSNSITAFQPILPIELSRVSIENGIDGIRNGEMVRSG